MDLSDRYGCIEVSKNLASCNFKSKLNAYESILGFLSLLKKLDRLVDVSWNCWLSSKKLRASFHSPASLEWVNYVSVPNLNFSWLKGDPTCINTKPHLLLPSLQLKFSTCKRVTVKAVKIFLFSTYKVNQFIEFQKKIIFSFLVLGITFVTFSWF